MWVCSIGSSSCRWVFVISALGLLNVDLCITVISLTDAWACRTPPSPCTMNHSKSCSPWSQLQTSPKYRLSYLSFTGLTRP
ncbi:hypothetical protein C8Q70DRAFT_981716 [Cubamyces menziesii]|nr:hypothetical protein C8Q70DRAFT_981716 [Cubamyces menziesii]